MRYKIKKSGFNFHDSTSGSYEILESHTGKKWQHFGYYKTKIEAQRVVKGFKRKSNPSELLKSGEWTPAHAIRIKGRKLEILR